MSIYLAKAKNQIKNLYFEKNITEPSEIDWLFCHVLKLKPSELILKETITKKQYSKIYKISKKRLKGRPLPKILKYSEFYGLNFKVNKNVLTPRKETELLVEQVILDYKNFKQTTILDLCTGSGCIAVVLKKHLNANITASDISRRALKVARQNAKTLEADIEFIKSDLFNKINKTFDCIVSNPPYIASGEIASLQKEVRHHDPLLALDGGEKGLDFYKNIIKQATQKLNKGGKIYLEVGHNQHEQVKKLLQKEFTQIKIFKDYSQIERIICATKKELI